MEGASRRRLRRPRSRHLLVEVLEDRTLLSSSSPFDPVVAAAPVPVEGLPALAALLGSRYSSGLVFQSLPSPALPLDPGAAVPQAGDSPFAPARTSGVGDMLVLREVIDSWHDAGTTAVPVTAGSDPLLSGTGPGVDGSSSGSFDGATLDQLAARSAGGAASAIGSDAGANDFRAALTLLALANTVTLEGSSSSVGRVLLPSPDPFGYIRGTFGDGTKVWTDREVTLTVLATADSPGFLKPSADGGVQVCAPSSPGQTDRAAATDFWAALNLLHSAHESGEVSAAREIHLSAQGVPGPGTGPGASLYPPTRDLVPLPPAAMPAGMDSPLPGPIGEAPRASPEHAEATAGRSARVGVAEGTVLPPPDSTSQAVDPAAVKEPGRLGASSTVVIQSTSALAFAEPPGAPPPGAPAADSNSAGGATFVRHAVVPFGVHDRVVLMPVADGSGGAGSTVEGSELPTSTLPTTVEVLKVANQPGVLLEGGLPFDLPVLRQDVDAFLNRLGALGETGNGVPAWKRFGPWLVLLSAAAIEFARRWEKKNAARPLPADDLLLGAAFLPESKR
jgi:hypothetical protein